MALRQFVLVVDEVSDQRLAALFSRCDDATVSVAGRRVEVAFDRDAPTLVDAVVSAVRDLDIVGLSTLEVQQDEDLVTADTIAERLDRSPEAVRRWVSGELGVGRLGVGSFPPAVDWVAPEGLEPCYSWRAVVPWLVRHLGYVEPDVAPAFQAVNHALRLRDLAPRVERIAAVRSLIPG